MTGHGCSAACGWCGGCSVEADRPGVVEGSPVRFCRACDRELMPTDYKITMPGGPFCSARCAERGATKGGTR